MARKTDGEKIDELEKLVAELQERIATALTTLATLSAAQDAARIAKAETTREIHDLRREQEKDVAVLKRDVEEIRRWSDQHGTTEVKVEVSVLKDKVTKLETTNEKIGNRAWSVLPNVLGAIISGFLAAIVAYFVARK